MHNERRRVTSRYRWLRGKWGRGFHLDSRYKMWFVYTFEVGWRCTNTKILSKLNAAIQSAEYLHRWRTQSVRSGRDRRELGPKWKVEFSCKNYFPTHTRLHFLRLLDDPSSAQLPHLGPRHRQKMWQAK